MLQVNKTTNDRMNDSDGIAMYNHAVDLHERGLIAEALSAYDRAAIAMPDLAEPHFNKGLIYYKKKNWSAAATCFVKAIDHNPGWVEAYYNLAQCREETSQPKQAIETYQRALKIKPDFADAIYNLGLLYLDQAHYEQAVVAFGEVISLRPDDAAAYNNYGHALQARGDHKRAREAYKKAGRLNGNMAQAWFNLGELEHAQGQMDAAVENYRQAIRINPGYCVAHNNLGNALRKLGQYVDAALCYRQVLAMEPDLAEAHYNLGSVLRMAEEYHEALVHLLRAVELKPEYAEAWNNLALACKNIGDLDRALTCFNRAIEIDPHLAIAHWNRSFVHLLRNEYELGWADFEWRFKMPQWESIYPFRIQGRRWQGQPVPGKTILVYDEQGLGDTIQFVRYLPRVKSLCGKLLFETRAELKQLLQSADGIDEILLRSAHGHITEPYDYMVPLMSLPGLFETTAENIPFPGPYLHAEPDQTRCWQKHLSATKPNIGLVWAGRPQHTNDGNRSCPLSVLAPLLEMEGVHFVGLQKGPGADQIAQLPPDHHLVNLGNNLNNFSETAALLASLDLLITVDTAVAHLAGAMGRQVWVLIPFIADWRWGMQDTLTPWYPSMRLFRQREPKAWENVMQQIVLSLKTEFVATPNHLHQAATLDIQSP